MSTSRTLANSRRIQRSAMRKAGTGRLSTSALLNLYRRMVLIRYFEQKIEYGFSRNQIHGTTHLCIGQEAVPVGVCAHLSDNDYVVSNHRGHGHALSKGLDPERLMAEIMGKAAGYCKGKGGTQHIAHVEKGFLGTNGITGGGIPIAIGAAFTIKYKGRKDVSVCFFGDGATNQGTFHESLNMASLWKLPVLFVCENNLYAMSTHVKDSTCTTTIAQRAQAYNMQVMATNGMDVLQVYEICEDLISRIRAGYGPIFLECKTYRFKGHSKSDPRVYRSRKEEQLYKSKCPILKLRTDVINNSIADQSDLDELERNVQFQIDRAYENALNYPHPDVTEAMQDVFCE